ncbi:hypothetical protein Ciccas_011367, partial [Cichlidogyrus casuarinus]
NYQFDKLRGLASGIGMSGAGFGYLIVPLLVQNVLQRFDWRTSLLVNLIVCALAAIARWAPKDGGIFNYVLNDKTDWPKAIKDIFTSNHINHSLIDAMPVDKLGGESALEKILGTKRMIL